jgi:dTMP kinase
MIIAIEGIDASGKQTLAQNLFNYCSSAKIFDEVRILSFPDYTTPTGKEIHRRLRDGSSESDPMALQSLMTINRYEHVDLLHHFEINTHKLLILDRYYASGLAYGEASEIGHQWLVDAHAALPSPHYWIYLDIPVNVSMTRRKVREDNYEKNRNFLLKVRENYFKIIDLGHMPNCLIVDVSEASAEDVASLVITETHLNSRPRLSIFSRRRSEIEIQSQPEQLEFIWTDTTDMNLETQKSIHMDNFTPKNITEVPLINQLNEIEVTDISLKNDGSFGIGGKVKSQTLLPGTAKRPMLMKTNSVADVSMQDNGINYLLSEIDSDNEPGWLVMTTEKQTEFDF